MRTFSIAKSVNNKMGYSLFKNIKPISIFSDYEGSAHRLRRCAGFGGELL